MHPYLARLKVKPEVDVFFRPFYRADAQGDLLFDYGGDFEHFGLAFHKVPVTDHLWMAGNLNFSLLSDLFICGSALEAVAYLSLQVPLLKNKDAILFLSVGAVPTPAQLAWCRKQIRGQRLHLLFPNDLTGRICDLKVAATLRSLPLTATFAGDRVFIYFRNKEYAFVPERFSLNAFDKLSGYRFSVNAPKSRIGLTFFDQLKAGVSL